MNEKRVYARIEKEIKAEVHSEDGMTFSTTVNVSSGGLFISTPEPLQQGSAVKLSLYLSNNQTINVKGVVKWKKDNDSDNEKSGMGVEFVELSQNELAKILDIIK